MYLTNEFIFSLQNSRRGLFPFKKNSNPDSQILFQLKTVVNADAGSWINLHQFNTNNHVVDPFSPFKVVSLYRDSPKSQIPNIFDVRFRKIHVKIKENLSCGKHPRQLVFCVETENPHTEKFDDVSIYCFT